MAKNLYKRVEKVFSISLGPRGRWFETSHSDQNPSEINDFRGVFLFFVYCGADFELLFLTHIFDEHRLNIVFFAESQYN